MKSTFTTLTVMAALLISGSQATSSGTSIPTTSTIIRAQGEDIPAAIAAFNKRLAQVSDQNQVAINWDGAAVTAITQGETAALPEDLFLEGRQVLYGNLACTEDGFVSLRLGKSNGFTNSHMVTPFSPDVTCGPSGELNNRRTFVNFTQPDLKTPGAVYGFGTVFQVVDGNPRGASLNLLQGKLGERSSILGRTEVPNLAPGTQYFVGVVFDEAIVSAVNIDYGIAGNRGGPSAPADNWFFDLAQNPVY